MWSTLPNEVSTNLNLYPGTWPQERCLIIISLALPLPVAALEHEGPERPHHLTPPTTAFRGGVPMRKVHHVPARENFSKGERARYTRAGKVPMGDLASEHGAVGAVSGGTSPLTRSEERRVGKECA